jgi:hypothetical protein
LRQEFDNQEVEENAQNHHYLIENFGMEARAKINKNPLGNALPQLEVDLIFGGHFDEQDSKSGVNINIHQPQIMRILKLLEYIGFYNQFQSGALTKF